MSKMCKTKTIFYVLFQFKWQKKIFLFLILNFINEYDLKNLWKTIT